MIYAEYKKEDVVVEAAKGLDFYQRMINAHERRINREREKRISELMKPKWYRRALSRKKAEEKAHIVRCPEFLYHDTMKFLRHLDRKEHFERILRTCEKSEGDKVLLDEKTASKLLK
jgi:hypothetical protein